MHQFCNQDLILIKILKLNSTLCLCHNVMYISICYGFTILPQFHHDLSKLKFEHITEIQQHKLVTCTGRNCVWRHENLR